MWQICSQAVSINSFLFLYYLRRHGHAGSPKSPRHAQSQGWLSVWAQIVRWITKQVDNSTANYNWIVFDHKKENFNTRFNSDEPGKCCTKWKKPGTKDHVLHDSIYIKHSEKTSLLLRKKAGFELSIAWRMGEHRRIDGLLVKMGLFGCF